MHCSRTLIAYFEETQTRILHLPFEVQVGPKKKKRFPDVSISNCFHRYMAKDKFSVHY